MTEVYLGLGSNIGDSVSNIREAVEEISSIDCIQNVELSPIYRTAPIGKTDQDWFANAAVRLETSCSPSELLEICLKIELGFKRVRVERWGPRTLDIDILLFGNLALKQPGLEIPHPRISERAFVLKPLLDLNADLKISGVGLAEYLQNLGDQKIEKVSDDG